jgi:hypothetical protein
MLEKHEGRRIPFWLIFDKDEKFYLIQDACYCKWYR